MEGVENTVNFECKIVNELKGELAEAYKKIAEKEAEIRRLVKKNAVLEKRYLRSERDARGPEVKPSPMLERKAEEIIPKECWALVFQNLNAEDLLNCRQVCKSFNQVLNAKEFKEKWKFKLILPLLFLYLKTIPPNRDPSWKHLYNARLACRSWCHWIDNYASEAYGTSFFPQSTSMPLLTSFRTLEQIEEFQQRFGKCNTNPFPSRSVYIEKWDEKLVEDEDYDKAQKRALYEFCWNVGELLEQFGKHIFRLELWFEAENCLTDPLVLCKLMKRITIHLPNLKELFIKDQSNEAGQEAASYVAENALAALPNLQVLNIDDLNKKVQDYLLDAFGPQLTQLETTCPENLGQFQMQQLKNVQKLWLELDKPRDTLEILRFLESPLKLLKLNCRFGPAQETWNMDTLLCNLKHLPIEVLEIYLRFHDRGRVNLAAGIYTKEYNNGSIKTLIITIQNIGPNVADGQICFNFLQALTKLENLELKFSSRQLRTTHPRRLPEVVKLNEYLFGGQGMDLPYNSNIWEKVPSLKTITLSAREGVKGEFIKSIYTREEYERRESFRKETVQN